MSGGRVQHYFPTRENLLGAAFDRANALAEARIAAVLGTDDDPRRVLAVVLAGLIPHDAATRLHLRVRQSFTALALAEETIAIRLREDYARLHHDLAELLGRAGADDPAATAVRLVALAEGLAYYVLIGVRRPDDARADLLGALADACG